MPYPGGKGGAGVYQTIINQIPPHETYIEPFAGGAAIMRRKRPARCSIAVDLDSSCAAHVEGIEGASFVQGDAFQFLLAYKWTGREFVYADPPYLMGTRSSCRPIYKHELGDLDHVTLLDILTRLPCPVMISGYPGAIYDDLLPGWRTLDYQSITRGGTMAAERLWMNYPEPAALHDYSFVGDDYRERERIKKRVRRWRSNFEAMQQHERQAVLSALVEAQGAPPGATGAES